MAVGLRPGFEFAVDASRCFIRRKEDRQRLAAVEPIEAELLLALATHSPPERAREGVFLRFGEPGCRAFDHLAYRLGPLLVEQGAQGSSVPPSDRLRAHVGSGMRSLPGPKILHWSVTRRCPRACIYCFAEPEHGSSASDSTLPRQRLSALLQEAATLGAKGILLSGSEPLLRGDLPEVIGDAHAASLEVLLTTKHPISEVLARRLASAGLRSLALSVDTMDPELSRGLIGSASYPAQVRRSVENLKAAGMTFSLQAVLTPATAQTLDGLLEFAEREEAAEVQLVPFERVRQPLRDVDQATLEIRRKDALELTSVARRAHPRLPITLFEKNPDEGCNKIHCDIGATKMFFTPAGRVHRCYKLTDDATLFGPDLNELTIARAWHDEAFAKKLLPERTAYAGTACHSCGRFDKCHSSGRCIFDASIKQGQYAAPDRPCGRSTTLQAIDA
jgi:molybdenum cofactor biosynthesis enzyme MoaA